MNITAFSELRLVGGTALALQIGHRNSVDIDLFGQHQIEEHELKTHLSVFKDVEAIGGSKSIKAFFINDIKVDIVNYPYAWLDPIVEEEGIRMASKKDIAAMKIAAITQRGSKKDFIDLFFLLKEFKLSEVLSYYRDKISDSNEWMAIRSIAYFGDADREPMPAMFKDTSWQEIKENISEEVRRYTK